MTVIQQLSSPAVYLVCGVIIAFDQVVPALFGALAFKYYRKNLRLALWPLLLMSAVFILLPALQGQTSILVLPAGGLAILLAWLKFRKERNARPAAQGNKD